MKRSPQARLAHGGYSFVELMAVLALLSTAGGVGLVAVQRAQQAATASKLGTDVAAINRSVQIYALSGGVLPKSATGSEVLTKLKSKTAAKESSAIVGHTGSFIDPRLTGVSTKKKGALRAVWDRQTLRFVVDTRGDGFSEFVFDDKAGAKQATSESRKTVQKFAQRDAWVWDYEGNSSGAVKVPPGDANVGAGGAAPFFAPQAAGGPSRLLPPQFSVPAGLHDYAKFPMPVLLTNPNPSGSSSLFYSLNNGLSWSIYNAASPPTLPQNQMNATLQAYSASTNSEKWLDSPSVLNLYQTIFFTGSSSGLFHDPKGDARQETNLLNGLKLSKFTWGVASGQGSSSNSLDFSGVKSFFTLPEQEFKLGDLSYNNGTTKSGTNSTSVELEVTLQLTVPQATERLNFTLNLQSTPNKGKNQNDDADYVWIPTIASKFSTIVQGQTFYLQLRFGQATISSFTTIDEFHVWESKNAKGAIYGTLTTTPTP